MTFVFLRIKFHTLKLTLITNQLYINLERILIDWKSYVYK